MKHIQLLIVLLPFCTGQIQDHCLNSPCENDGTCEDMSDGFICQCDTGFYGDTCESVGYEYSFTRLISVDKTLMTSVGQTVTDAPLETDIKYETSYTTPLVIGNTPGGTGSSEYDCMCTRYGNDTSEEEVDKEVLVEKIQEDLLLDRDTLTKTIRKHNSVEDDRPSAKGIGGLGGIILILTVMLIVLPDVFSVFKYFVVSVIGVGPAKKKT